ncbi:MAG TPA: hypothetical protein PK685_02225 [archaeon]|jgi:hypothetical protein|nr:hypothetical protein [archaeon]
MPIKPQPKPKGVLKIQKTASGTKQVATTWKGGLLLKSYERHSQDLNNVRWTPAQLEKLKKIGKENAKIVKAQEYLLKDHKINNTSKPRQPFFNAPVAEIGIDHKNGNIVFTTGEGPIAKKVRITRVDLLKGDYYKESGLFNDLLDSRRLTLRESDASVNTWRITKKRKVVDLMRFLKLNSLQEAGIHLSIAKKHFTLPEILQIGRYPEAEIRQYYTPEQILDAKTFLKNTKNSLKVFKSLGV